jgi:hypothetical protein
MMEWRQPDGSVSKCWGRGEWKVYLNEEPEVLGHIRYVERNPVKERKPPQRWSFVLPYPKRRST